MRASELGMSQSFSARYSRNQSADARCRVLGRFAFAVDVNVGRTRGLIRAVDASKVLDFSRQGFGMQPFWVSTDAFLNRYSDKDLDKLTRPKQLPDHFALCVERRNE